MDRQEEQEFMKAISKKPLKKLLSPNSIGIGGILAIIVYFIICIVLSFSCKWINDINIFIMIYVFLIIMCTFLKMIDDIDD